MKKLGILIFVLFFVGAVASASVGEVHIHDNAGGSDYVTYFLDNSTNESSVTKQLNSSGLGASLDSVENDGNLTQVKYSLSIGESTGLFSGKLSAEQLKSLNVSEVSNFTVFYPSQADVEGPVIKTGADFVNDKYSIKSFDEDITYEIGMRSLLVSLGLIASFIFLPFFVFRRYAEKVYNGSGNKEEKIYRLNRVMSLGTFPLMILLVPAIFELGFISIGDMLIASILPDILDTSFAAVMLVVMIPIIGSIASTFLGIYPYMKKLRDLDASKKSGVKKLLAGLGLVFVPIMVWQFFVFNISSDLTSNLPFIIIAFGVFLLSIMAVSPYLIMIFQSTRPLEGSMREKLESFCNENGYSLRDIKIIEAKGVKSANAVVAGTIPGFNYVFITDYLIENFSENEVEAILAHELGHLEGKHLWIKGVTSFLFFGIWMTLVLKANVLVPVIDSLGIYGFMGSSFAMILIYFIGVQGVVSSKLEYRADRYAKNLKGEEVTVSALKKLADANDMKEDTGKLFNLVNLHPSMEKRVESLRDTE